MTYIKCSGCGEIIEIPDELSGDWTGDITYQLTEPYYCDACEPIAAALGQEQER